MSQKYKVIEDLENFPIKKDDGGIYGILPFEKLDSKNKAVFKVGQADSFSKRFEQYHTYYPAGFYISNVLELKAPKETRSQTKETKKTFYNKVEKFIHKDIQEKGGKQLISTTRVRNASKHGLKGGETEFFYTGKKELDGAFKAAKKKFGGVNLNTHLNDLNKNAKKNKKKSTYSGQIFFEV